MTQRLYYKNSFLIEFDAQILEQKQTERGSAVKLDKTAFYPTSGGQPFDIGILDRIPVTDVWESPDGDIWHLVENIPTAKVVHGKINWDRRFDHMQQHTGQHLLSAVFSQELNATTIGFHLGSVVSTIDLDYSGLSKERANVIECMTNQIIWANHPVTIKTVSQDEIQTISFRKPPQVEGDIRVIWIEGHDASACGGTHVSTTGQIGLLKITKTERYKQGMRVSFLCGKRALEDYQQILGITEKISTELSIHRTDLPETIANLQDDYKESSRELRHTKKQLVEIETIQLWADTPEIDGIRRITGYWEDRNFEELRTMMALFREKPNTLALLAATESDNLRVICGRSDDLDVNAAEILKKALDPLEGRGGGPSEIAQGGAPKTDPEIVLKSLKNAISFFT